MGSSLGIELEFGKGSLGGPDSLFFLVEVSGSVGSTVVGDVGSTVVGNVDSVDGCDSS